MPFTTLIQPAALAADLADPRFVIVDCRFALNDAAWGEAEYRKSHIPGAVYADLKRDLSGAPTGRNGRHPLPTIAQVQETFGRLGIDRTRQVVAYDQDTGMFASRLWWMLRWMGHDAVAVLDGGFARWLDEGYSTTSAIADVPPRRFEATPRPQMLALVDDVTTAIDRNGARLLDARAPERFSGAVEPIDKVGGHIPGARNYHYLSNVDAKGRFRPAVALRSQLTAALDNAHPDDTICYCGSGVTACHALLAMEHAGLPGARLYAGSWSEWSSDEQRAIEKSD
jgi:thiosulfate/3-mercaptopyruvate sulfurtransferase